MATILPRRRADGTVGYMATIRLHNDRKVVHRESKTFSRRAAAEKWARAREVELEDPTALLRAQEGDITLASLIRWYIDSFQNVSNWQRTKQCQLQFLEKHPIGQVDAVKLTSGVLVNHARSRRANGAAPATVSNDLTWIAVVLRAAKSVKGAPVVPAIVEEARMGHRASESVLADHGAELPRSSVRNTWARSYPGKYWLRQTPPGDQRKCCSYQVPHVIQPIVDFGLTMLE